MATPEIITAIKDIMLSIAATTTAIVAFKGLKNWNRELKGKADFEVARNIIRATYKLRDEIQNCRSRFISAYEFPKDYKSGSGETLPEAESQACSYVYKNRWATVYNAILEFDTHSLETEALWDKEIRNRTDSLRQCAQELYAAIEALISDKANRGEHFKSDREYANQIRSTVSASPSDKNNQFSQKMLIAVGAIEEQIRPHLRRNL